MKGGCFRLSTSRPRGCPAATSPVGLARGLLASPHPELVTEFAGVERFLLDIAFVEQIVRKFAMAQQAERPLASKVGRTDTRIDFVATHYDDLFTLIGAFEDQSKPFARLADLVAGLGSEAELDAKLPQS